MSDRVAVFNKGRIEQVDTPRNLYMRPATPFVAEFVGTSNVLRGALAERLAGSPAPFSIRPEHIRLADGPTAGDEVQVAGLLHDIQYQGAATRYEIQLESGQFLAVSQANNQWHGGATNLQPGQAVTARWPRAAMVALREDA
ncbi:polyamine ABC transporter, ATP-binding protein [compost metagenome]